VAASGARAFDGYGYSHAAHRLARSSHRVDVVIGWGLGVSLHNDAGLHDLAGLCSNHTGAPARLPPLPSAQGGCRLFGPTVSTGRDFSPSTSERLVMQDATLQRRRCVRYMRPHAAACAAKLGPCQADLVNGSPTTGAYPALRRQKTWPSG